MYSNNDLYLLRYHRVIIVEGLCDVMPSMVFMHSIYQMQCTLYFLTP
jgi:hypothetical protein